MVLPFLTVTVGCIAEPVYSKEVPLSVTVQLLMGVSVPKVSRLTRLPEYLFVPLESSAAVPLPTIFMYLNFRSL